MRWEIKDECSFFVKRGTGEEDRILATGIPQHVFGIHRPTWLPRPGKARFVPPDDKELDAIL
jgi:hypothetical protein